MKTIRINSTGPAVKDVQQRLCFLGYDLGDEAQSGVFGQLTEDAVVAFRRDNRLLPGKVIDKPAWSALVDATFTLGDRVLYLRMPYFHGRDVHTLQSAMASLGFICMADGIFGAHTERAVREFQINAGLQSDGIVGDTTFKAIERLQHAWQGKEGVSSEGRTLGFARAAEVLENTSICVFGNDSTGRTIAERVSNLAMATTSLSKVVCAQSLSQLPDDLVLMVGLTSASVAHDISIPLVQYDNDETLPARLRTAIESSTNVGHARIMVQINTNDEQTPSLTPRQQQHCAIALLDAICLVYS